MGKKLTIKWKISYKKIAKIDVINNIIILKKGLAAKYHKCEFKKLNCKCDIPNQNILREFKIKSESFLEEQLKEASPPIDTNQHLKGKWINFIQPKDITNFIDTGFDLETLKKIGLDSVKFPQGMNIHPRLLRTHCKAREDDIKKNKIDWATSEAMALGSLLMEGYNIRLCGQDTGRGTFSQRHAELIDQENEKKYIPLNHISPNQGELQIVNSPLSELAVLGFEYGYSIEDPNILSIWEAQFGDFANGAQIIIDQFISSGEAKWLKQTGLVMLLPHGYDGAGPEHSNARMERFLQLCNFNTVNLDDPKNRNPNMRIVNITTPANYFHALRRQMKTNYRKPLIVISPKTLLRHAKAVSTLEELQPNNTFIPVIGDNEVDPSKVTRLILCSGKFYYDLQQERQKREINSLCIIRIEELCPFPLNEIQLELSKYPYVKDYIWCQDESQNAGGWYFVQSILNQLTDKKWKYIGRPSCAASAVGITVIHKQETQSIFNEIFS
jgi:probable 2-oxoglutarate dehydrogenase E1 component DHKTD1